MDFGRRLAVASVDGARLKEVVWRAIRRHRRSRAPTIDHGLATTMGDAYLGDEVEESFPLSARVIGLLVGGSQPVVRGYFEEAVELIPDDFGCSRVIVRRAGLGSQLSEVVEIGADRPVVSE